MILFFIFFKKKQKIVSSSNYIFFLYGGIGDCLMQLPSIFKLSRYAEVIIIIPENLINLFKVDRKNIIFIPYKKNILLKTISYNINQYIKKNSIGILFSSVFENYLIFKLLNVKYMYGFVSFNNKYRSIGIENIISNNSPSINKHENYNNIIDNILTHVYKVDTSISVDLNLTNYLNFETLSNKFSTKYIIININKTNTWPAGRWTSENFKHLIKILLLKYQFNIVLTGSKEEMIYVNNFYSEFKDNSRILNYCGKTSLIETFFLINESEFVITCDSGIMHISSFLNKLCFSIFSFSDPNVFTWGKNNNSIFIKQFDCMPCVSFSKAPIDNYPVLCKYNSRCDKTIKFNDVLEVIENKYSI
jgi:ADP-heptose:LPS heptosyltransferase